ncbi:MAG: hypothetical protein D6739_08440, partial [Nitrospirae bacterium]
SLALLAAPAQARSKKRYEATPKLLKLGKRVYRQYCVECHGEKGDGLGESAKELGLVCRDFTLAVFKFRTTPSGYLPTDEDLYRTITHGIRLSMDPERNMRPFKDLSRKKRWAVLHYIKTFSDRWKDPEEHAEPITIPDPPPATRERIANGRKLWGLMQCRHCHGDRGKGDGPSAAGLKDHRGYPIRPADFTNLELIKGGHRPRDIYRTFTTGLDGTPMPSFGDSLSDDQRWDLVYFVLSLGMGEEGVLERYGR